MFSVTRTTLYLVFFCTLSNFIYAEEPVHPDVRIVVDISGSMKKNDPNNLRIPAVNMLLGLLPDNATAGVWTFGRYVNMLVPHKPVNDAWRAEARKKIPKINSVAQYTNIELALKKAGYDLVEGKTQNN
ncbi:MAG: VWA domain-containing protein, partial [Proteobacteria bacterium]|nr:VWA domain-containing protein [Pseudomonadota bacterium]